MEARCNDIMGTVNNLAEVVQQQVVAMQQMGTNLQHVAHDRQNIGAITYKCFMELDPPAFKGKTDPEAAESWIHEIEHIFRVLDVPEEQESEFWYLSFEGPR